MGAVVLAAPIVSMSYIYNAFGQKIPLRHIRSVEQLVKLKSRSGSSPWPVIEKCFDIWAAEKPAKWKSYVIYIDDVRKTRKDPKFASTKDPITGGYLRYTVDIPQEIMMMIRCIYSPDELPMNREFFIEFAHRFPKFRIAQKL